MFRCPVCKSKDVRKRGFRKNSTGKKQKYQCFNCKRYGLKHNNPAERYNGKLEDRLKIIRGGFGSFDGAKCFMDLQRVLHNFVNPHQELKEKTPAEMAEITLPLKRNKLLNLIRYHAKTKR